MSETRALSAALSSPVFHGAASRSALHTSDRHVERWAPEGEGASRASGMRSLAFADRVASPWMTASHSAASRMFSAYANGRSNDRAVPEVSWLFPRPWFQDELDWMAAARQGLEATPRASALSTRGTFMDSGRPAPGASWAQMAMPVLAPSVMASVAPSMRPSALADDSPMDSGRMWSPSVPFAAATAAEVVAGAMRTVESSGLPAVAGRSPIWSGLAVVTPRELAGAPSTVTSQSQYASSAPANLAALQAARASIGRIDAQVDVMRASALPPTITVERPVVEAPASAAPMSRSEQHLASAAHESASSSAALRVVELLLAAATARATHESPARGAAGTATASSSSAASAMASPSTDAPSGASSTSFASPSIANFAPSAGPRVAMSTGLGGLVRSLETARAVAQPMSTTREVQPSFAPASWAAASGALDAAASADPMMASAPSAAAARGAAFSPVWAARPTSALSSVVHAPARAVDHLTWSDRWLARFAGASPVALSSFATGHEAPSLRQLSIGSPEVVYVHPMLQAQSIAATAARSIVATPLAERGERPAPIAAPPRGALRIDDGDAVPDALFAAIAAAAVAPAPSRPAPARADSGADARVVRPVVGDARVEPTLVAQPRQVMAPVDLLAARASVADLASIAVPTAPDAGLAAGLASSPIAPALAAVMPMASAPVFDPRSLRGAGLTESYLGGLVARAASPIGVLTGAPTMASLAAMGSSFASASAATADSASAMSGWSLRDLALAPVQMRLAAAAPDRAYIALGGDVPVTMRATRHASLIGEPRAASSSTAAVQRMAAPMPLAAPMAMPPVSVAPDAEAAPGPTSIAAPVTAPFATDAPAMVQAQAQARAFEAELMSLRAALLAGPDASSVPLAHAPHAPLVSAATSVPSSSATAAMALPSLGGVGVGSVSPLGAALARHAAYEMPFAEGEAAPPAPASAYAAALQFAAPQLAAPGVASGGVHAPSAAGRPGSLAESALAWSIGEARSIANLSFDFVTPEMVLAARVYGLPAGAAAEAMRVAAGGSTAMANMAAALDLTFLRAFQAPGALPAGMGPAGVAASSTGTPRLAAPSMPVLAPPATDAGAAAAAAAGFTPAEYAAAGLTPAAFEAAQAAAYAAAPAASYSAPRDGGVSATAAFEADPSLAWGSGSPGVWPSALAASARTPRGAYLWPSAAIAALGLSAMSPDGVAGLPVVALELLAAQAVAELGTWVTAFPHLAGASPAEIAQVAQAARQGGPMPTVGAPGQAPVAAGAAAAPLAAMPAVGVTPFARDGFSPAALAAEAADTVAPWSMPALARQRFEAVYVALAQSAEGQSLSPAARAARAMSLLTRGDTDGRTTRQLAAEAWSVLPHVYRGDLDVVGVAPQFADSNDPGFVDSRPGLAGLAARAGDLLGSFVAPSMAELRGLGATPYEAAGGPASRAAAPVYVENASRPAAAAPVNQAFAGVRPGRAFEQSGGGEPSIPGWFESAAQKMFASGGDRAGMSLAQMVLVTAMPSQQIAAATKGGGGSSGGGAPQQGGGKQGGVDKPDVEKLAHEVFQEVMALLAFTRIRSGDPFQ